MTMWNRSPVKCCTRLLRRANYSSHTGGEPFAVRSTSVAGFTLFEVLVAVAVVAIALVTFMGLHLHSLDDTIRAQDLTTAVLLAQAKMAAMGESPEAGEATGKFEGPELERFQWVTAVTEHTLDAISGSKPVTVRHLEVTVRWVDGQ